MKRIKVLYLIDVFTGSDGGTEQHLLYLLKNLPRSHIHPHVAVLYPSDAGTELLSPSPPLFLNAWRGWSVLGLARPILQLVDYVNRHGIDIVHTFFSTSETAAVLGRLLGMQQPIVAARRNAGDTHTWLSLLGIRLRSNFISTFLFNSYNVSQDRARLEHIPIKKVAVIVNPAPKERILHGLSHPLRKKDVGVEEGDLVVGIVGTIRRVKDHETFLRAARLVLDRVPNTTFLIVGRDETGDGFRLKEIAQQLGIAHKVRWLGVVGNPLTVIHLFDVGVLCSRSEGLSNTLIEYAAAGIPTVATDVGGNGEVVTNGVNGFLVPPGCPNELAASSVKLLSDPGLRRTYGLAGRAKVAREFEEGEVISAYAMFYRKHVDYLRRACAANGKAPGCEHFLNNFKTG
jgi:glycosyltransferase involved in cell wall biosynthesis